MTKTGLSGDWIHRESLRVGGLGWRRRGRGGFTLQVNVQVGSKLGTSTGQTHQSHQGLAGLEMQKSGWVPQKPKDPPLIPERLKNAFLPVDAVSNKR